MHKHLVNVREDMGAHHDYNAFRFAADIISWHVQEPQQQVAATSSTEAGDHVKLVEL